MRDFYPRLLTILGAAFVLWLILGFWPLAVASKSVFSLLVVLVCGTMVWRQAGKHRLLATRVQGTRQEHLPPEDYQGAVILVCGDNTALFAPDSWQRETCHGWYLRVEDAPQLPLLVQLLNQYRPALVPQLSILLATFPEQHVCEGDFTHRLRGWQRAVGQCHLTLGCALPLWGVTWVSPPVAGTGAEPVWFSALSRHPEMQVHQPGQVNLPLSQWVNDAHGRSRLPCMSMALWLGSLLAWRERTIQPVLSVPAEDLPGLEFCQQGVCVAPVKGEQGNLWQQHIASYTALPPDVTATEASLPLPDLFLPELPHGSGIKPQWVFWRYAGFLGGAFLALAMLASWVNNQQLIRNIGDHLALYQRTSGEWGEPRLHTQQRLQADATQLGTWQRLGVPQRYSLGLYQGERLLPLLEAALISQAPPPLPLPVATTTIPVPETLNLDSLSLFDSGKYTLKPGSSSVLESALVAIRERPGGLVVIAGHTDNTGNPAHNQLLSLKRAEAVRDWMRDTGGVPESCFAVQGYGESSPVAPNGTPEGRARNRRVEITLLPGANACQVPGSNTNTAA
ncbi:OmpA family protein [Mangrovibacter sp. SLW1]